jgi:UDP-N-acetylmuramoyl-L-alanyl-D-glutamate--2,6-diaminopimelate ligase
MLDAGDRSCAMEATSHGSELGRLAGTRFAALAFTNLTQDHLDLHGTMERYFDAKRRLFLEGEAPPAAVNVGDPYGRRLAEELRGLGRAPMLTFASEGDADLVADRVELSPRGARIGVDGLELETQLLGRFNVENVLAAVAVARLLELPDDAISRGIASVRGVPGRFEPVDEGQPFLVVVDYSHKPDALENALGCGGDRDRGKRPLMGRAAEEGSDVAILTSDNPRSEDPEEIVREVLTGVAGEMDVELDRRKAIETAIELAQPGDLVLIAGKGHELGQELRDRTIPFDDREVARDALRRLGSKASAKA